LPLEEILMAIFECAQPIEGAKLNRVLAGLEEGPT
jgi:hypothetical protein